MSKDRETPRSILLTEDGLLVRHCIAQELRDIDYVVYEPQEAVDALSLLITNIRMPETVDGLQLARRTREEHPVSLRIPSGCQNSSRE